jgi:poly(3-hydroxybutyrate) depolymerase
MMAHVLHSYGARRIDPPTSTILLWRHEKMDLFLRSWENCIRGGMHNMGNMYQLLGTAMSMNPFAKALTEPVNNYGKYLKERNLPIEEGPWMTENKVVHRGLKVALRKFNGDNKGNPVLLVPPEAGHNSQIVDFGPDQSLVQCALKHFSGDVYVAEKLPAAPRHANYSIEDCVRSLDLCVEHIGKPVHLIGLCQGGWQSAMYAALFTERVKTLTLAGAPIDFHAGDSMITRMAQTLPMSFYQSMVDMGGGCMPGAFIVSGFKLMNAFDRFIGDDTNLFKNINNPKYLDRYHRFNRWYQFCQPLGGRMYLEVVNHLFKQNQMVKGEFKIMGRTLDLSRIYQPLFMVGGTKDDITPPAQLFALRNHVSSVMIEEFLAEAGHIGVFMATQVINTIWTDIFKRLSNFKLKDTFDVGMDQMAALNVAPFDIDPLALATPSMDVDALAVKPVDIDSSERGSSLKKVSKTPPAVTEISLE